MAAYWKTVSRDTQLDRIRAAIDAGRVTKDVILGEMVLDILQKDGGLKYVDFAPGVSVQEMITTDQGSMDLLEKVRIDVAFGEAETPLLYGPIYDRIAPANGFPGGVYQLDENVLQADVIFLEKFEGGEVQFGTLSKGAPSVGAIQTYAAGFEWTEDVVEYDRTWSIELQNRALGRAYNALLNHLHLSPILGFSYQAANQTAAVSSGATLSENTLLTLRNAYTTSVSADPRRTGTILLASEVDRFQIEDALLTPYRDEFGNALPNVPIDTIIYYDGETLVNGQREAVYPGVTPGECYLISPKRQFKELVHHDLRIDIQKPSDISRLIEGQQVARSRRGLFAAISSGVEEITLP